MKTLDTPAFEEVTPLNHYQSINPSNGKLNKTFASTTDKEMERALSISAAGFEVWRRMGLAARAAIVSKATSILRASVSDFARLVTLEMGKLMEESRREVLLSADIIGYYSKNSERFLSPQRLTPKSGEAFIESAPLGVLFGVQSWSFPYYQLARFVAPNLMAGNAVIVKHAGCVPQCAAAFEKLWLDAGAPVGVYTNLRLSHEQVGRVIDDPRVQGVAFTGSAEVGKLIAARAGQNLKKSTMELGGSDAFIVLEDADLDKTVKWAAWSQMNNTGQSCVAAKRFIVVEPLAERFLEKLKAALMALRPGDPMEQTTTLAPLASEEALNGLLAQIESAVSKGATLLMGGKRIDRPGFFLQPTLLSDIRLGASSLREELFGPVSLFFRVKNEEEALSLANRTDFGLGSSVFTKDHARGKRVASLLDTGMVFINRPSWTAAELPFGGIKNSGYGRELSSLGIHEFVNKKLIRVASIDSQE